MLFNKSAHLLCHIPWVNQLTMLGDYGMVGKIHLKSTSPAHQVPWSHMAPYLDRDAIWGHGIFPMDLQLVILLKNQLVLPNCLVLWNMNGFFSIIWLGCHPKLTDERTIIFQDGYCTTNQPNDWPIINTWCHYYYQINMWLSNQLFIQISVHPNDSCKYLFIQPTVLGFGCTGILQLDYPMILPFTHGGH